MWSIYIENFKHSHNLDTANVMRYLDTWDDIKLNIISIHILDETGYGDSQGNFVKYFLSDPQNQKAFKIAYFDHWRYDYHSKKMGQNIGSYLVGTNIITNDHQIKEKFIESEESHENINFIKNLNYLDIMLSKDLAK